MGYVFLGTAILFSVIGNLFMKLSRGFKETAPTVLAVFSYIVVTIALTFSIQYMEMGVAYAVWSGTTILLVALIGILFLKESRGWLKYVSLLLISLGVALLQIAN